MKAATSRKHEKIASRHQLPPSFHTGGDFGRVQFLPGVSDWSPVPGPQPRLSGSWPRPLRTHLHPAAVLLLRRLAQGQREREGHTSSVAIATDRDTKIQISDLCLLTIYIFCLSEGCRAADQPVWRRRRWLWDQLANRQKFPGTSMLMPFGRNCVIPHGILLNFLFRLYLRVCLRISSAGVHDGGGRDVWRSADDGERSLLERLQPQTPLHRRHSLCPPQTLLPGVHFRHGVSCFLWIVSSRSLRVTPPVTVMLSV